MVRLECLPEGTEERAPGFFFHCVFRSLNKAAREQHCTVIKAQRANHPITVEPVVVTETAEREAGWSIHVVRATNEFRNLAFDVFHDVRLFTRRKREGALDERSVVFHQSPPTPASNSTSSATTLCPSIRPRRTCESSVQ